MCNTLCGFRRLEPLVCPLPALASCLTPFGPRDPATRRGETAPRPLGYIVPAFFREKPCGGPPQCGALSLSGLCGASQGCCATPRGCSAKGDGVLHLPCTLSHGSQTRSSRGRPSRLLREGREWQRTAYSIHPQPVASRMYLNTLIPSRHRTALPPCITIAFGPTYSRAPALPDATGSGGFPSGWFFKG